MIYSILLSWGKVYIDQTVSYVKDSARKHFNAVKSSPSGILSLYCSRCGAFWLKVKVEPKAVEGAFFYLLASRFIFQ